MLWQAQFGPFVIQVIGRGSLGVIMEDVPTVMLIIPSATYRAAEFLGAAAKLGVDVVTGSDAPATLAANMGDHFIELELDRPDDAAAKIVLLDSRVRLDAVIGVDDQGLLIAAIASERLGLRSNPPSAVTITRNKVAMRSVLATHEVCQPGFEVIDRGVEGVEGLDCRIVKAAQRLGYPCVVKPSNQAASRGVIRIDNDEQAAMAAHRIEALLASDNDHASPLLVERFIAGAEIAIEGLLHEGKLEVLAVFDKPDPLDGPFFEETIYVTPSSRDPVLLGAASRLVGQACAAIGLVDGPVHAEVRLVNNQAGPGGAMPVLVEVAARTIGGRCSQVLSFSRGKSLEEIVIAHALGLDERNPRRLASGASGVMMLPIASSGWLVAVDGCEEALATEGITKIEIAIRAGTWVEALPEGNRYLGFLFARGRHPADVEQALRRAHAKLDVQINHDRITGSASACATEVA